MLAFFILMVGQQMLNAVYFPPAHLTDVIVLPPKKHMPEKSFLHQKYVVEGLSSKEIAAQISFSRATVTKYLNDYGIPLKKITRRKTGKMVYGYRQYGGRAVVLKKELKVIELIKSHKESGYSYQKIADILNNLKAPTKGGKGFWYSKVVRQVYLRSQV